ncbi:unnamed protein product [Acanthoscelides obtectus]|uniref:Uncharacterized protein n=1 Tax=Acanthoscelides obtectus TaxID=200917 RepID=A0A9P0PPL5_ACAOB|nr:unnamed protein product [Acanthoscelides obtectus]CAK1673267.1 hypothetical protein AOBTE_LOCUS29281 [Acanthoscelides obtectus]
MAEHAYTLAVWTKK